MTTRKYPQNCLGVTVQFDGPSTVQELESIVGANAAIEAYMTAYGYQRNQAMYPLICEKIEGLTGEERKSKTEGEGEKAKKVFTETAGAYINRLQSSDTFKDVLTDAELAKIVNETNAEVGPWTFKPVSDRKPAVPFYLTADNVLAKISAGQATQEQCIAKIESTLGGDFASMFGEFNRDNLARAAKAIDEKKRKEAAEELL